MISKCFLKKYVSVQIFNLFLLEDGGILFQSGSCIHFEFKVFFLYLPHLNTFAPLMTWVYQEHHAVKFRN